MALMPLDSCPVPKFEAVLEEANGYDVRNAWASRLLEATMLPSKPLPTASEPGRDAPMDAVLLSADVPPEMARMAADVESFVLRIANGPSAVESAAKPSDCLEKTSFESEENSVGNSRIEEGPSSALDSFMANLTSLLQWLGHRHMEIDVHVMAIFDKISYMFTERKVPFNTEMLSRPQSGTRYGALEEGLADALFDFFFGWLRSEPEEYPGRGLPLEETCALGKEILQYSDVLEEFKRIAELTDKKGWEYSAWIVMDPPGHYKVVNVKTSKRSKSVKIGRMPKNAIAHMHTHYREFPEPSDGDIKGYKQDKEKMFVNFVVGTSYITIANDVGERACVHLY